MKIQVTLKIIDSMEVYCNNTPLGAFAKLQKATIRFVKCLSVHMEQQSSHWREFH